MMTGFLSNLVAAKFGDFAMEYAAGS